MIHSKTYIMEKIHMRKAYPFLSVVVLLCTLPVTASAENILLSSGYTEDGIYYEVFGDQDASVQRSSESTFVTRTITFSGNATPSASLAWSETIKGFRYAGTLHIVSSLYSQKTNTTTATYEGTLYLQD